MLAACSPALRKVLARAGKAGHAYVVIDGTLMPVDRVAADRPFYSSKHHRYGMNPRSSPARLGWPAIVGHVSPVIVLNGGSSSGKTSIARCLQRLLGPTWMTFGVDDLIRALPGGEEVDDLIRAQQDVDGAVITKASIEFGSDGSVMAGDDFRRAEACWYAGLAEMSHCGADLILDEVFLGGRSSQQRVAAALAGLPVIWVGVRCDPDVAAAREHSRSDRVEGMARLQATQVHEGVVYDLVVDTTAASAADCAGAVASHLSAVSDLFN